MRTGVTTRFMAILATTGLLFPVTGCIPAGPPSGVSAPELPPLSSFVMSFDNFVDADSTAKTRQAAQNNTSDVRDRAVVQVVVWQSILTATLAIPVAALAESFNHEPVWQGGLTWLWSYEFRSNARLYTAELTGTIVDTTIEWEMRISRENDFTDVLWFSGTSDPTARSGSWTVNRDPNQVIPFVQIDYARDASDPGLGEITYTSIEDGAQLEGSYIIHASIDTPDYDRAYDIYIDADDNLVEIEWDRLMQDGRAKDPAYYGDSNWRCWSETLQDIDCP